jgi:hypothetical protein
MRIFQNTADISQRSISFCIVVFWCNTIRVFSCEYLETTHVTKFYVVSTVHFGMKLYNEQINAQVFNLVIYGYGVSARALTPYPGDLNHCRSCTPASEDGLKESPNHVRQK